jgi:presenilin-like A22 family membrane protease
MNWAEVKSIPAFVLGVLLGLVKAVFTEPETFLIAVLGVLVGLRIDALTGAIVGLLTYIVFRFAGQYVLVLAREIRSLSTVMGRRNP